MKEYKKASCWPSVKNPIEMLALFLSVYVCVGVSARIGLWLSAKFLHCSGKSCT